MGGCFASEPPAVANRELIPSCPSFLLGEEAEALEGAGRDAPRVLQGAEAGQMG